MSLSRESSIISNDSNISNDNQPNKKRKLGGPNFDEIWRFFIKGKSKGQGHYEARCRHCDSFWTRGRPHLMKAHLANYCEDCPNEISTYWQQRLANEVNNYTRNISECSSEPLPRDINNQIDQSLLKAWVMARISFDVIENPFMKDFLKNLNSRYTPPLRTTLSERLLNEEIARVMALESDDDMVDSDELSYAEIEQETLVIDDIVDLTQNYLEGEREMLDTNDDYNLQARNMSYSPEDLVARFLEQLND
ncbi:14349_t:CDS:2 [Cetraspora pellucida]|uniref:14349_t:CDS:1 n=1 Tax=Cetraspora pellucida TaxID=1433469 RepID=A0ACA9K7H0_9GLOM|nr:14349_t:CDS:2 [Cetraspora pellucida]